MHMYVYGYVHSTQRTSALIFLVTVSACVLTNGAVLRVLLPFILQHLLLDFLAISILVG